MGGICMIGSLRRVAVDTDVVTRAQRLFPGFMSLEDYIWDPPIEAAYPRPRDLQIGLRCLTTDRGRLFFGRGGVQEMIPCAFVGGLLSLVQAHDLSPEQRSSYCVMWWFYIRLQARRERLKNTLRHLKSLHDLKTFRDLLARTKWSFDRFCREGRLEARRSGINTPREEDIISYGLARAARDMPLYLENGEVRVLIRLSLFEPVEDMRRYSLITEDQLIERIVKAVEPHLYDSNAKFLSWFAGGHNTLVQQIAKRKTEAGGQLPQELVKSFLVELGWRAHYYVGGCIHAFAKVFRSLLDVPLTAEENRWYERSFFPQTYLGDLPFPLLADRWKWLKAIRSEVRERDDNREAVAVMHRMLAWYHVFATERRENDREQSREITDDSVKYSEDTRGAQSDARSEELRDFAELCEVVFEASCTCGRKEWTPEITTCKGGGANVTLRCGSCGDEWQRTISNDEIGELRDSLDD